MGYSVGNFLQKLRQNCEILSFGWVFERILECSVDIECHPYINFVIWGTNGKLLC